MYINIDNKNSMHSKLTDESSIAMEALSGETFTEMFGWGEEARFEYLPAFLRSSDWFDDEEPLERLPTEALTPRAYSTNKQTRIHWYSATNRRRKDL